MNIIRLNIVILLAFILIVAIWTDTAFAQAPYDPTGALDKFSEKQRRLLKAVQSIADQKETMSQSSIENILGTRFTKDKDNKFCFLSPTHPQEFWFTGPMTQVAVNLPPLPPPPPGVLREAEPPQLMNIQPAITYCEVNSDTYYIKGLPPNRSIEFHDVMGYACIGDASLQNFLPKVRREIVVDGPITFGYSGYTDDSAGIRATFAFYDNCLNTIKVEQKVEYGLRYGRALANFSKCKIAAMDKFCNANTPPLDPPRLPNPLTTNTKDYKKRTDTWMAYFTDFNNRSDEFVKKECGTLTDFYNKEPLTGLPASGTVLNYGEPPSCKKK